MSKRQRAHNHSDRAHRIRNVRRTTRRILFGLGLTLAAAVLFFLLRSRTPAPEQRGPQDGQPSHSPAEIAGWTDRAVAVSRLFHRVYTPCWEGAYGAIGDAYLFASTGDSTFYRFHLLDHDLRKMCEGTWVDDRAWVCLAELKWWELTGKSHMGLVQDAMRRYNEARDQGRLANREGFWTWYNWPPGAPVNERIFTNSNMNQMATVASELYRATGERKYLRDALLVWQGDGRIPGIVRQWYKGKGIWEGRHGPAAFGKELPWNGLGCAPLAASLYKSTGEEDYKDNAVATVRRILDPSTGWVDPADFFQLRMDGNGVFVNALLDVYAIAPRELSDLLPKIERMLEHVWTNHGGTATVTLHRISDHGIRNGWNPNGGEEGYGVGEVGTVHAQGEALRAFGTFAYYRSFRDPAQGR